MHGIAGLITSPAYEPDDIDAFRSLIHFKSEIENDVIHELSYIK